MNILILVGFVGVWIWVWHFLARKLGRTGKGWFVRHFIGTSIGLVAGFLVVFLALSVGIISSRKKEAGTEIVAHKVDPAPVASPEISNPDVPVLPRKTLEITPDAYANRLNEIFKSANLKHRVSAEKIVVGEVNDVLNVTIGKYAALVASVSKVNGQILDIVVTGVGDGTSSSGLEIMMIASAALVAAAPDVEFSEVFRGLPAMIKGQDRTYGNVKLSAKQMDGMGTWFFASPI
ncbi:hypothetical protein [Pseudomonas corrugata]|uniref:hypothetical protein n=1 Tax=Pseudomonas corrugata TaxID=47879 RepID=UPI0022348DC1|nr:hypothetical protein [Pseudomonas corrugata]UZE07666.1 hypothetical protein LOY65_07015 [Pseudomonas corrugata]